VKISVSLPEEFTIVNHGYGVISREIVTSLQRLGYEVPFRDPTAPVWLNIGQPYHWMWAPKVYRVGLVAWESNKIPDNWKEPMRWANEIWTPSPVIAQWYADQGFPAKVYEHGVDSKLWRPKRRERKGPIRFLHMGEPAPRKGGQLVYDAFRELYGNSQEATLTIKAHGHSTVRGRAGHPWKDITNVKVITDEYTDEQMVELVRRHDVLVYPSYGEGFGLIPLQAMVTGMPTICTEAWASYKNFILPELRLASNLGESPWQFMHPGQVFFPDDADLRTKMTTAVDKFDDLADRAYNLVPFIQKRYDWDRLTRQAFAPLVQKFSQSGKP
jgi:glycosyltransferase involved in cell wall biosynthesis